MKRSLTLRALALALVTAMAAGAGMAEAQTPKKGGVLRIGNLGEPPSLDPHWGTQTITEVLANHIFEGLYAVDEGYQPIPMLAESHTVSRDGLVYTFKLRKGVSFHNGKEMTADDVVPSLVRWGKRSVYGKSLFVQVVDLKAVDKYTVEMKLKEKSGIVLISLAVPNNMAAIYPKEIAEKFPPDQRVTEWVGTGPFKLAEWKPDQYIRMVRFDGYKPVAAKQTGYGGAKIVHVDELRWVPVPDVASRAAQVESGDLDFGDDLDANAYERLAKNPNVRAIIAKPYYWLVAVLNKKEGLMTNQKLRQAWQAAIDIEPIMKTVAAGKSQFYRMDSSLAFQELPAWHTKIQGLPWNEHNKDKAKKLLQEAGYKGEPIRFMTTQEYKWMYDFALVSKQQLEDVGFKIDLQVMDWSTLGQRRVNPKEYDVFTTGIGQLLRSDPSRLPHPELARVDDGRGVRHHQCPARPRDRPQEALCALGAADQALLRQGSGHPLRRPFRPARGAEDGDGLQREDRAPAVLGGVAGEIASLRRGASYIRTARRPSREEGNAGVPSPGSS